MKPVIVIVQMEAFQNYFPEVLFVLLLSVVPT